MELDLGQTLSLSDAAAALGVTAERVRQRATKGALTGAKNDAGAWEITIDGKFLELAEAARLRELSKARAERAPNAEPNLAPESAPTDVGASETGPKEPLLTASLEPPKIEPKRSSKANGELPLGSGSARTDSVTAKQVERGTVALFGLIASVRGQGYEHWRVDLSEVQPWSAEAAALVNSLPLPLVTAAASVSGVGIVAMGMFGIIYSRMAIDNLIREQTLQATSRGAAVQGAEDYLRSQRMAAPAAPAPEPGQVVTTPGTQGAAAPVGPRQEHPIGGEFFTGI